MVCGFADPALANRCLFLMLIFDDGVVSLPFDFSFDVLVNAALVRRLRSAFGDSQLRFRAVSVRRSERARNRTSVPYVTTGR
jgi:hypothetical protein